MIPKPICILVRSPKPTTESRTIPSGDSKQQFPHGTQHHTIPSGDSKQQFPQGTRNDNLRPTGQSKDYFLQFLMHSKLYKSCILQLFDIFLKYILMQLHIFSLFSRYMGLCALITQRHRPLRLVSTDSTLGGCVIDITFPLVLHFRQHDARPESSTSSDDLHSTTKKS